MHSLWEVWQYIWLILANCIGNLPMQVAKRTPRYLKNTSSLGIKYQQSTTGDWVGDKDTHCSTFGFFSSLLKLLFHGSKKQTFMVLSNIDLNIWP
jgi:hypothetical protein